MESVSTKAVFLSYAREDSVAAQRIAEALRGRGIEVWFDQDELRGGDAWEAKIRRQINECALFMPVISANTNLRLEGYFRREWKQAVERTHGMDDDLPFLVPVVIDAIPDAEARVPERFRMAQWTRLPGGAAPPAFGERIRGLLQGNLSPPAADRPASPPPAPTVSSGRPRGMAVALAVLAVAIVAVVLLRPWASRSSPTPGAAAAVTPAPSAPPPAEFPADPDLKKPLSLINNNDAIPEDYSLAEDLVKGILNQRPTDPDAVTVMADIYDAFLYRGFDRSQERMAGAQRYAERAAQLAPDSAYAQGALGVYLYTQDGDLGRAVEVLNKAIQLNPQEASFYRFRDDALFADRRITTAAAIASAEKTVKLFPQDALAHYELSRHYRDLGRIEDMERELDRTIAIEPIANAVIWKARVALWVRGDPEEMKAIMDRLPARGRSLERSVIGHWIYAMVTGKVQEGLEALAGLPETWVNDYDFVGPKAVLEAALLESNGQRDVAQLRYASALAEIKQKEAAEPGDIDFIRIEAWTLHGMGRDEEARRLLHTYNEAVQRPYRVGFGNSWWFTVIPCNLLLGDRATAVQLIREAAAQDTLGEGTVVFAKGTDVTRNGYPNSYRQIIYQMMRVDPRMAPFRADPEIKAILAPPAGGAK